MKTGLYDQVVDLLLKSELSDNEGQYTIGFEKLDPADSHDYLARHLHALLSDTLSKVKPDKGLSKDREKANSKIKNQISLCNEIIDLLQSNVKGTKATDVFSGASRLLHVLKTGTQGIISKVVARPDTPLAMGALLTGTKQDPSLISQLNKEIITSDQVDILVSFIKWTGVRILAEALKTLTDSGGRVRVISTSYMGATDLKAIDFLRNLQNTEVKISFDTHRTRLHAKSYLFHRQTGFSTAYIGSSNISNAALTDGLEWNIKVSEYEQSYQWEKIAGTFESYWNDSEFEAFTKSDRERFQKAIQAERSGKEIELAVARFDLRPYPFQEEILDRIQAERDLQRRNKHLIVAATGTGKTIIAAFDFKRWLRKWKEEKKQREPRFLFVAHREEILKQSLAVFRGVLGDHNFGDLMVGGHRSGQLNHLFISIQTFNSQNLKRFVEKDHYDYLVVDEFHHAAAPSYKALLEYFDPECLLGLTATPERADGLNIKHYFDDHITAEIRLPDAINRKLLVPFQYFGISDSEDYSPLKWQRGGYHRGQLDKLLTGNDIRANLVIRKTREIILNPAEARGLGFCVSQAHAEFMASRFNKRGINADFLTAKSEKEHRRTVQQRLVNKKINFIFVVDLYNEGVDIPELDVVLFLRPTESLTVFLQQLGRGLRMDGGKDCLTVLDFVGQSHKKFRFDLRYGALLSKINIKVDDEVKEGFPHLPAGCTVQLERQAQKYVLDNIRASLVLNKPRIIGSIASFEEDSGLVLTMANFINYYKFNIDDIYRRGCWSRLCYDAAVLDTFVDPDEEILAKGLRRIAHINDPTLIEKSLSWIDSQKELEDSRSDEDLKRKAMLHFSIWGKNYLPTSLDESFHRLRQNPTLIAELIEVLKYKLDSIESISPRQLLTFSCPLQIHCQYTRDEILAGLGKWDLNHQPAFREGTLHLSDIKTDAFFITLNKSEEHYSPTTMYEDYAISKTLFHWQSQSTTSGNSETGQRYINHKNRGYTILLFVREERKNKNGLAEPYYFLGEASYVSHKGSNPISFVWKLHAPMPPHLARQAVRLVSG